MAASQSVRLTGRSPVSIKSLLLLNLQLLADEHGFRLVPC